MPRSTRASRRTASPATATRPRWSRSSARWPRARRRRRRSAAVDFLPHLIPMTRGILSACHVRPTRPVTQAELDELYAAAYGAEPFVTVVAAPPVDGPRARQQSRPGLRPGRRSDRPRPRARGHRQPREGGRGPGCPGTQPGVRTARDGRPRSAADRAMTLATGTDVLAPVPSGLPEVERAARIPKGFEAAGRAIGIKASGRPDLALIVATGGPARGSRRLHAEHLRRRARSSVPGQPREHRRAGHGPSSRRAGARTPPPEPPVTPTRHGSASSSRGAGSRRRPRSSTSRRGSSGRGCRSTRSRPGWARSVRSSRPRTPGWRRRRPPFERPIRPRRWPA